jgi:hypothetical protein
VSSAADWIRYFDRVTLTDTRPELAFDLIAQGVGFEPTKPRPVELRDDEGNRWTFRPDRLVEDVYVEILGPHHFTEREEAKTRWRSDLVVRKTHRRLMLIDSPLLDGKQYWTYVGTSLVAFVFDRKRRTERLYA